MQRRCLKGGILPPKRKGIDCCHIAAQLEASPASSVPGFPYPMLTAERNWLHHTLYTHRPQWLVLFKAPEDYSSLAMSCIKQAPGPSFQAGSSVPLCHAGAVWEPAALRGHPQPGGSARGTAGPRDAARAGTSLMQSLAMAQHCPGPCTHHSPPRAGSHGHRQHRGCVPGTGKTEFGSRPGKLGSLPVRRLTFSMELGLFLTDKHHLCPRSGAQHLAQVAALARGSSWCG